MIESHTGIEQKIIELRITVVRSNARQSRKNSSAKITPVHNPKRNVPFLNSSDLLNISIHSPRKKIPIRERAPAEKMGSIPIFVIFISTWLIPSSAEKLISDIDPIVSILFFKGASLLLVFFLITQFIGVMAEVGTKLI